MTTGAANSPSAPALPRRRARWLRVLAALLVGCAFAAALLELGFRLFWPLPPWFAEFQQAGMYVAGAGGSVGLTPGYRGTLRIGDDATTDVVVNSLGLRGPELGLKADGERRVLMVGDSLVFGYGVEHGDALPARLEVALRAQAVAATVGNGGIPGLGPSHAVARMADRDAAVQADAFIVCGFLGNDAIDDALPLRTVYAGLLLQGAVAKLSRTSWRARLALRSRACLWLESWILTNAPAHSPLSHVAPDPGEVARTAGLPNDPQQHAGLFLDAVDENVAWQAGAAPVLPRLSGYLRESLGRAKQVAGARPLWFLVLPTLWQVDESKRVSHLRELGFDPAAYERGRGQRRWLAVAQQLGIAALDATAVLAAQPDPAGLFLADGGHLSVRGNDVVGKWLAAELAAGLR